MDLLHRLQDFLTKSPYPVVAFGLMMAISACGGKPSSNGNNNQRQPLQVTVATVAPQTVTVEAEYAGRVRGPREVEVRSRIDGIIERRLYQEGQRVEAGDVLFRIDQEPFIIALRVAEADLADSRAAKINAQADWQRVRQLYEKKTVSRREMDQSEAEFLRSEARLEAAKAAVY